MMGGYPPGSGMEDASLAAAALRSTFGVSIRRGRRPNQQGQVVHVSHEFFWHQHDR